MRNEIFRSKIKKNRVESVTTETCSKWFHSLNIVFYLFFLCLGKTQLVGGGGGGG